MEPYKNLSTGEKVKQYSDIRSKKVIFVPFCLICQGFQAQGIVKKYPAIVKPVVDFLMEKNINLIQMPCPETEYKGLARNPAGKKTYDTKKFRSICEKMAREIVKQIKALKEEGFEVLAILGWRFSPACAVKYLFEGYIKKGQGVFIEELKKQLAKERLKVPFLGVNVLGMKKTLRELSELIGDQTQQSLF